MDPRGGTLGQQRSLHLHGAGGRDFLMIETVYLAPDFLEKFVSNNLLDAMSGGRNQDGTALPDTA